MNAPKIGILLFFACALSVSHAMAEPEAAVGRSPSGEALNEIVVTAARFALDTEKTPASVSVVAGVDVQQARQQLGLDEALAAVPGVFFQNRYNFAQDLRIAIRGFGARSSFGVRGIKILIDDIPETLADGQSQVDSVDLASVRQIEVLRGPASAIYGNAAGGVIHIRSELGGSDPYIESRLAFGDFGFRKHQFKAGGSVGRLDYLLSLSDLSIEGYREHSEAENTQFNSRFRYAIDDRSEVYLSLSATDQPLSNDPGGVTLEAATANPRAARDRNVSFAAGEALDQQKLGLSYVRRLSNGAEISARYYALGRDFVGRLPFTGGGIIEFDRLFVGGGISYQQDFLVGGYANRLIAGVDYDRQRDDRQRFDNLDGLAGPQVLAQDERVTSSGVYIRNQVSLSERLELSVGLRYDRVDFSVVDGFFLDGDDSGSRAINDVSPSAGFVFAFDDSHSVYGSVATAFQSPTSTEFAKADGSGGFNSALEPEKSTSLELGLRGSLIGTAKYELAAFTIDVDDELIAFEIESSPGRDFFANAGRSKRRGLEFALSAEPVDGLSLSFAYTWSRFKFERFIDDNGNDFSGNTTPGIPESFARAEASYRHGSNWFASMDVMYVDRLFANNANSVSVKGATIASLRAGMTKRIGRLEIEPFLGINNATDSAFTSNVRINAFGGRYYEPGPRRNLYAGLSFRYRYSH